MHSLRRGAAIVALVLLAACEVMEPAPDKKISLRPVEFAALPGWPAAMDDGALAAWRKSCTRLLAVDPATRLGPDGIGGTAGDWHAVCRMGRELRDGAAFKTFLEHHFVPHLVYTRAGQEGIFTGYFEPVLNAAPARTARYRFPIYRLPADHVVANLGDFDPALAGKQVVGRVEDGRLRPYFERAAIDQGALGSNGEVLYWAEDRLDVFILQVQGSGIVALPDGRRQRVGFAGHNGHDYGSIGRWLIAQRELAPHDASWQSIRGWMERHPERVAELLARNKRYIFFRAAEGDGPQGVAGIELTPGHSLAVDPKFMPLHVPLWLDAEHPLPGEERLRRLVVPQDVGNAIRGPVRGDLFWGSGRAALEIAGRMKSRGAYYLLLPETVADRR